jgi:hypothetical protein
MIALDPPFQTPHSTKQPGTFPSNTDLQESQSLRHRIGVVMVYRLALNIAAARGKTGRPFRNHVHRLPVSFWNNSLNTFRKIYCGCKVSRKHTFLKRKLTGASDPLLQTAGKIPLPVPGGYYFKRSLAATLRKVRTGGEK